MSERIEVVQGDITRLAVDAIVNAANSTLLGGGGVDGAIHRAAGPKLMEECRSLGGCESGEAKITGGYHLPAGQVIHTVGPIWRGGHCNEDQILANCYVNSLELAVLHGIRTIAFPSISTGAYGFPLERAARIAVRVVSDFVTQHPVIETVILVCFDGAAFNIYQHVLREASRSGEA